MTMHNIVRAVLREAATMRGGGVARVPPSEEQIARAHPRGCAAGGAAMSARLYYATTTIGVYFWADDYRAALAKADSMIREEARWRSALVADEVKSVKPGHDIDPDWADDGVPRDGEPGDERTVREIVGGGLLRS